MLSKKKRERVNIMKTITRKRLLKTRYEVTLGSCFVGLHLWKYSVYVGKPIKRLKSPLKSIKDVQGLETITSTGGA